MTFRRGASLLLAALLFAGPAYSQPSPSAASPYEEALTDLDEGRYSSACPKLEAVVRAEPEKLIAQYKLGGCYLALGKLASAHARFVLVRDRAREMKSADQAQIAEESAAQLEGKLAHLKVEAAVDVVRAPGLSVLVDGAAFDPKELGVSRPVDVGPHQVEATAASGASWKKVVVVDTNGKTFTVTIPSLFNAPKADATAPLPAPTSPARVWQRPSAFAAGGLGVAAMVAGLGTGIAALGKRDESRMGCRPDNHCNEAGYRARNEARDLGGASTALWIAGGTLLSLGVLLFATAPRPQPAAPPAAEEVRLGLGVGQLTITGRFY